MTDTHAHVNTPSPAPEMVASGTDIHSVALSELHARQDPYCTEREALRTMIAMAREATGTDYELDDHADRCELAFVTVEHVETVAVVDLRTFTATVTEEQCAYHTEAVDTLEYVGVNIHVAI